ncbi:hypothetical protein CTZ05_11890 [Acinetobacter baumannii]|nr:hypothetical protein [Acinetobacter baumannii]
MLTNAKELKGGAFTFIIDLAYSKAHRKVRESVCFFVVCEINIAFPIFIVNSYSDIFIVIPILLRWEIKNPL